MPKPKKYTKNTKKTVSNPKKNLPMNYCPVPMYPSGCIDPYPQYPTTTAYCPRCGDIVQAYRGISFNGFIFHDCCFTCANPRCTRSLQNCTVHTINGDVYCSYCGPRIGSCSGPAKVTHPQKSKNACHIPCPMPCPCPCPMTPMQEMIQKRIVTCNATASRSYPKIKTVTACPSLCYPPELPAKTPQKNSTCGCDLCHPPPPNCYIPPAVPPCGPGKTSTYQMPCEPFSCDPCGSYPCGPSPCGPSLNVPPPCGTFPCGPTPCNAPVPCDIYGPCDPFLAGPSSCNQLQCNSLLCNQFPFDQSNPYQPPCDQMWPCNQISYPPYSPYCSQC